MNFSMVVYLLYPTSNHNNVDNILAQADVVYLLYPTSNHNLKNADSNTKTLYIFCILHQTTTKHHLPPSQPCCISFVSYIKPQPFRFASKASIGCISFVSYIKPQPVHFCCALV